MPAFLIVGARDPDNAASYALWFGNWLISGFAIVLLAGPRNEFRGSWKMPRGWMASAGSADLAPCRFPIRQARFGYRVLHRDGNAASLLGVH